MIITVTLNAAIDKTLEVPSFTPGRRHRTVDQRTMAGGKGVNIARAIKQLGQPVIATGFAGGATGTRIIEALGDESILNDFVRIHDESRTNTVVLDPTTGSHTEVNERGPAITEQELELFREKLLYLAQGASICVFAGSLPRRIAPEVYPDLIREVRRLGVTTMIDTDGEPLRLAMRAEPDVVSPNELEAEELVGHEFNDVDDHAQAVIEMTRLGAREAIMTVPDGCYARCWRRQPIAVPGPDPGAGGPFGGRSGRCLPGRLRGRALRRAGARGLPALRRRLRRGVHAALRRRDHRSGTRRATVRRGRGRTPCRSRPRSADLAGGHQGPWGVREPLVGRCSVFVRPPERGGGVAVIIRSPTVAASEPLLPPNPSAVRTRLVRDGSRDRSWKEGPSRLRVR